MIKTAFQIGLKKYSIPIFKLPNVQDILIQKTMQCKKFKNYVQGIENAPQNIKVEKIQIISVEMFGASNVGFVNMRAITLEDGKPLPSYVFLRGNAVAILLLVNGKILLVRQYRVPLQKYCLEAPAGMIDEDGDFTGVAAKEIHEETGIKLTNKELVPLGSYHPSGGGCDEELLMFLADIKVSNEDLEVILNKIHGEGDHQRIQLELVDFNLANIVKAGDGKLLSLWTAYQWHIESKSKL